MSYAPCQKGDINEVLVPVQHGRHPLRIALLITLSAISFARDVDGTISLTECASIANSRVPSDACHQRSVLTSTGVLQGVVLDMRGAAVPAVRISAISVDTGLVRTLSTGGSGFYKFVSLPVGTYRVSTQIMGFKTQIVDGVVVEVGKTSVLDFELTIGDIAEEVRVGLDISLVDLDTVSVGQVITERTVQEMPLNGRYLVDLGLLVPGSVTRTASFLRQLEAADPWR